MRLSLPIPCAVLFLLGACATQPAYRPAAIAAPAGWANAAPAMATTVDRDGWWTALHDPVIDALVAAALRDNPTLAEAAARTDQARALLAARGAQQLPSVNGTAGLTRSRDRAGGNTGSVSQTSASLGASLSWEIDLWGRVREGKVAARSRLDARAADTESARLSVIGDIADTVLALRACEIALEIRDRDIASREAELEIGRARLSFGNVAAVTVVASESNLAATRTDRIVQAETCQRLLDSLVALSGVGVDPIRALLPKDDANPEARLPVPPPFIPALPATVLLGNPGVVAAEREVAARWSEIAIARAERLPRLDLAAMLTGQWIRALGSNSSYASNSVGVGLTGPLVDGGAGAATVRGAEAAYREAMAQLAGTIRIAVRDIEDGLAAQQSALARIETSKAALAAARFAFQANEARWRAGAIAQYELEEARRRFRSAQEGVVVAMADRARAWVALVRRTGPTPGARG